MSKLYTGVRVLTGVAPEVINQLYKEKAIDGAFDKRYRFFENEIIVLKSGSQSAIGRHSRGTIRLLPPMESVCVSTVRPRNKEQNMALDLLTDPMVKVMCMTGTAGTGKTLLALAYALQQMEKENFSRLILSRPMSQVGKRPMGILPGEVEDKFGPYLDNYMDNIEHLLDGKYKSVDDLISQYRMEFKPLQMMRWASWKDTLVIADEVQVLDHHEMATLGTRVGEGSKIIIMGDLNQRDESIAREKTGLYKFMNSERTKEDPIVASIELIKCERSETAALFAEVFGV